MESGTREQTLDQHSTDLTKYSVLITWGGSPTFRVPTPIEATSFEDAAKRRVALLSEPERYDQVAVTTHGRFGLEARVFDVKPLIEEKPKPKPRLDGPVTVRLRYEGIVRNILVPSPTKEDSLLPWIPSPEEVEEWPRTPRPRFGWTKEAQAVAKTDELMEF